EGAIAETYGFRFFFLRYASGGEGGGLLRGDAEGVGGWGRGGICGNFLDHLFCGATEVSAVGVPGGDGEGTQHEAGAGDVDLIAHEGVDDFHKGALDGFLVFEHGDGMD